MIVEKLDKNVEIIQTLGTYPNQENGLSVDALKAKFDEAAKIIKEYLNNTLVPALASAPKVLEVTVAKVGEDLVSSCTTQEIWEFCNAGGYVYAKLPLGDIYPLLKATESEAWFIGNGADGLLRSYYIDLNEVKLHETCVFAPRDDSSESDDRSWSAKQIIQKITDMIAENVGGGIDVGDKSVSAGKFGVGDPDIRAEITYDRDSGKLNISDERSGSQVRIPVEDGIDPKDAVNLKQLQQAFLDNVLIVTTTYLPVNNTASHKSQEIWQHINMGGVAFLKDFYFDKYCPCICASPEQANFAFVDYVTGFVQSIYVNSDGSVDRYSNTIGRHIIDNFKISGDRTWSSEKIVESINNAVKELSIPFDMTDNTVQICPIAGIPVKVTAEDLEYPYTKLYCCGKNLFDATATGNMTEGYILYKTGGETTSETSLKSSPIPVSHLVGKTLAIAGAYVNGANPGWAFYNADNSRCLSGGNTATAPVPEGAAFFRFTVLKSNITVNGKIDLRLIQLEIGTTVTKVEPYREVVFDPNAGSVELDQAFLTGVNTFYAYAGEMNGDTFAPVKPIPVHVEGYKSPAEEIAQLRNTILAMGANI